jgi:uncharacterized membrane protein
MELPLLPLVFLLCHKKPKKSRGIRKARDIKTDIFPSLIVLFFSITELIISMYRSFVSSEDDD